MALTRPKASNVTQPVLTILDGDRRPIDGPSLTRAEASALRRSAPITYEQLRVHLEGVTDEPPPAARIG